jgi:hypothetical protein
MQHTPAEWQPSPGTKRFKDFSRLGVPWLTGGFAAIGLATFLYMIVWEIGNVLSDNRYTHFEWIPFWMGLGVLAVAATCGYLAFCRFFLEADGFLEIDSAARRILANKRVGVEGHPVKRIPGQKGSYDPTDYITSFDEIGAFAIATQQTSITRISKHAQDVLYTDRYRTVKLIALPSGVVLFSNEAGGSVRHLADYLSSVTGKPVIEQAPPQAVPMPPGFSMGMKVSVPVPGPGGFAVGNVSKAANGQIEVLLSTGQRVWVPPLAVTRL